MATTEHDIKTPPAGRPRDEQREQAILDAACELLAEVGYDQLTLETVAVRAHASKATIYRRWSNKAEVVTEALRRRVSEKPPLLDNGSLRADLLALSSEICAECESTDGALIAGIVRAMRNSAELADIVRANVVEHKEAIPSLVIERAIARGELPIGATNALANEVVPAMVFMRMLLTGEPLDESFVVHLIDDVMIPLLKTPSN